MANITVDLNSKIVPAEQRIWIVHPGRNRSHIDTFLFEGAVFLEFPGLELRPDHLQDDGDLRQRIRYAQAVKANRGFVRDDGSPIRVADFTAQPDTDVAVHLRTVKHLTDRMKKGDLVVVPGRGAGGNVLFGEVAGSFFPQQSIQVPSLIYAKTPVRRVNWVQERSKLELPADLIRYFEKPPAIAEVARDHISERFFDYAYDAYSTGDRSWVSLEAPAYDGSDFLSLIQPPQLIALAVSIYRAMETGADLSGLSYDEIIRRHYDDDALADAQMRFASPGRYNLRWRRFSVQFGGLAKVGSGSDYAASLCSGLALSGASPG